MKNDEKLHLLITGMMEYMAKQVESLPDKGIFKPHSIAMDYPGTDYEAFLRYEHSLTEEDGASHRISTAMRLVGSSCIVSHYLFKGTKAESHAWLQDAHTEALLTADYAELKTSVDRRN